MILLGYHFFHPTSRSTRWCISGFRIALEETLERERSIIPHLLARMIELEVLRILCEAIDINDRDRGRRQIDRFLLEFRDEREME